MGLLVRSVSSALRPSLMVTPQLTRTFLIQRTQLPTIAHPRHFKSFVQKVLYGLTGLRPLNLEERTQAIIYHQKLFAAHASVWNAFDANLHFEKGCNLQLHTEPKNFAVHKYYVSLLDKKKEELTLKEVQEIVDLYRFALNERHNILFSYSLKKKLCEYADLLPPPVDS